MFQFQYGAIWRNLSSVCLLQSRVSIPVWCDLEGICIYYVHSIYWFQFQYGAIWSIQTAFGPHDCNMFQFQYGAIWSRHRTDDPAELHPFQFQYGAIWSRNGCAAGVG